MAFGWTRSNTIHTIVDSPFRHTGWSFLHFNSWLNFIVVDFFLVLTFTFAENSKWRVSVDGHAYIEYAIFLFLIHVRFIAHATEIECCGTIFLWGNIHQIKCQRLIESIAQNWYWSTALFTMISVGNGTTGRSSIHLEWIFAQRIFNAATQKILFADDSWLYVY